MGTTDIHNFFESELHVGTITQVEPLPKAHVPAWVLTIDFGPLGIKKSSARITRLYNAEDLIGQQIIAVTNLPPRQVGKVISECLVLGLPSSDDADTEVVLLQPERPVDNGTRVS
ncbi:tRNA-binding protein [Phaeocystidibacter luteus]|uniref:tRNA-binding protein n=1 Tax=Phaeocystidibacter luteus TaxID=911197 RepID=A0A6N6RM00_9FLAO|nr:tRNA-binding protein [Phaeocystidibacter luteus]KAB2814644.1 tRNA-binding protein [Phaeocystidibacter luteus]